MSEGSAYAFSRGERRHQVDRFVQALAELYPASQRSEGDWLEECEAMHESSRAPVASSLRGQGVDLLLAWLEER